MERVVFRHLSGSKVNQVEEFPLDQLREVTIGRDPSSGIGYDPERDDLVGRKHARIEQDPVDPYKFTLVDLDSRNGTFVNRQRIVGRAAIVPGDVVQFGPGGPEFEFDIDPLPPHVVKKTRVMEAGDAAGAAGLATRVAQPASDLTTVPAAPGPGPRVAVGKDTVLRLLADGEHKSRRTAVVAVAAVSVVLLAVLGVVAWRDYAGRQAVRAETAAASRELAAIKSATPLTPTEIAATYTEALVFIEMGWKLIDTASGRQVYHEYTVPETKGKPQADENGNIVAVPLYLRLPDGSIEPALSLEPGQYEQNRPIGMQGAGSGFVVTSDGFILTNRHVAAAWQTRQTLPPGVLFDLATQKASRLESSVNWVPSNSQLLDRRQIMGKSIEGRLDYLDVTFSKNRLRIPARLVRISDRHDVALIKVDVPQPVRNVELFDNYASLTAGAAVTVMGFPAVSPFVTVRARSQDPNNRTPQSRVVPDPTVTPGSVGRILRGEVRPAGGFESDYSALGDLYQLTINATGPGNSGGPTFDDRGRVIGIYTGGMSGSSGERISFAVPIRYGIELLGLHSVID